MKSAIETLRISLGHLETNEPIHRAEGNTEQADLEAANAAEFRDAIVFLEMMQSAKQGGTITVIPPESEKAWREYFQSGKPAEASKPDADTLLVHFSGGYWRPVYPMDDQIFIHLSNGSAGIIEARLHEVSTIATLHGIKLIVQR